MNDFGETGKSSYRRGKNHLEGWRRKEEGNIFYEHCKDDHNDRLMSENDFSMKVTGRYRSSLVRQTSEGVFIDTKMKQSRDDKKTNIKLLNSQSRFHQPKLFKPRPSNIKYGD